MKRVIGGVCLALGIVGVMRAEVLNERESGIIKNRLVSLPQSVELFGGPEVVLSDKLKVTLACGEGYELAVKQTQDTFKRWFLCKPTITRGSVSTEVPAKADGYRIEAKDNSLKIEAYDVGGARNAMRTLRQMAEPVRETAGLSGWFIPETTIVDAPVMAFRGFHLCWFPENTPTQIEQYIRLAAYYKMNVIVLESWGMFQFSKYPELSWPESNMTQKEVRRLVKIANDLGVVLAPQINLFGHASGARSSCGKHATLDLHPRLLPYFEPDGWVWCLSNPHTLALHKELVTEMHDVFGRPPYFHLGCDEADNMATCLSCRRADYPKLVANHLTVIHALLAERNCKSMIWHDMFLQRGDARWKGYYAHGSAEAERMLDGLPRDIIICDWFYNKPVEGEKDGETYPTLRYFKSKGFPVLTCPWEVREGYVAQAKAVSDIGIDGMLSTTWHHLYGSSMHQIYMRAAYSMWGTKVLSGSGYEFARHLRQVGWDIPIKNYRDTGWYQYQLPESNHSPR